MTTYRGLQVLDVVMPDRAAGIDHEFLRPMNVLANPLGRERFRAKFGGQRQGYTFRWICPTRASKGILRDWIDTHRGAAIPFWVPTYARDLVVYEAGLSTAEAIKIERTEYTRQMYANGLHRRHIAIWESGTTPARFRGVTSSVELADYEQIGIDDSLGVSITTSTLLSFLLLVRLAEDLIQIEHHGPEFAVAEVPLIELPAEVPLPV